MEEKRKPVIKFFILLRFGLKPRTSKSNLNILRISHEIPKIAIMPSILFERYY
jgi:hypothetical protein